MDLPIIDAATLDRADTIAALHAACVGAGFFYLSNHAIEPGLVADAVDQAHRFFALPLAERLAVSIKHSACNRGYEAMGAQRLEAGTPPDRKEGFYIGQHLEPDHPNVRAGLFNQGPNQWPAGLPGFQSTMEAYFAAQLALVRRLMVAVARSLDLAPEMFDAFCDGPMAILRLLHYPPQPANPLPGEKGCGAHTDWGCLTLLLQDDAGGLQVQSGGGWIDAPPMPGTYVVNLGDMLARWTNDRYRSTLHRVVNRSGRDRYSLPFFFEGRPDYEIACLPGCAGEDPPRYAPTTVSDHLKAMFAATYIA